MLVKLLSFVRLSGWMFILCLSIGRLQAQPETQTNQAIVNRGDSLFSAGDYPSAHEAYRQAIAQDPGSVKAQVGLARIAMMEEAFREVRRRADLALEQDPDNLEAHYLRGISSREVAKYRGLLDAGEWVKAADHFQWVLKRDSLYKDVVYQYALFQLNRSKYEEAIVLGETQHRLKPELTEPRNGLFRFYRLFLNHTPREQARVFLEKSASPFARYTLGELTRKAGDLMASDSIFTVLQHRPGTLPIQPVLLSRARIHYALGQPLKAQSFVEEAIGSIQSPGDADLVFQDFKYLFTDGELHQYRSLKTPEDLGDFFGAFWSKRNPVPASAVNARLTEHYRRMLKAEKDYIFDGLRSWFDDPDKRKEFKLPEIYALNREFNDKGLIYIRHGNPAESVVTVSGESNSFVTGTGRVERTDWLPKDMSFDASWLPNESWRYYDPDMDFHFVIDEGGEANNWRLIPALTNLEMLIDREHWGGVYARLASVGRRVKQQRERLETVTTGEMVEPIQEPVNPEQKEDEDDVSAPRVQDRVRLSDPGGMQTRLDVTTPTADLLMYREEMVEASQEAITLGLATDRHTWSGETIPLEIPHVITAFRGEDGQTAVEIHFAVPIGQLTKEADPGTRNIDLEIGCAIYGPYWQEVTRSVNTKRVPAVPDEEAAVIDYCRMVAEPDSYQVAFHGRPILSDRLGGYRLGLRIPDFSGTELAMSDILPASSMKPTIGPSRFNRGDIYITSNPFRVYPVNQPVFLYFEVYNLRFNSDAQTRYTIEYSLAPLQGRRRLLGLVGRNDQPALSLESKRSGVESSPKEYAEIDITRVDPGKYVLTVKIVDELSGETTERSLPIELTK